VDRGVGTRGEESGASARAWIFPIKRPSRSDRCGVARAAMTFIHSHSQSVTASQSHTQSVTATHSLTQSVSPAASQPHGQSITQTVSDADSHSHIQSVTQPGGDGEGGGGRGMGEGRGKFCGWDLGSPEEGSRE
jgi:hypothetical protein